MTQDPRHAEIMQSAPTLNPTGGRLDVPEVVKPGCPRDCSGRHEHDGWLVCPTCHSVKYAVVLHEWKHQGGHYFNKLEPMNGAAEYKSRLDLVCCGGVGLARRWKR